MKIRYFRDTDTLYIELRPMEVEESRDLDEDTIVDVDAEGKICAITLEHASVRAGMPECLVERIPGSPQCVVLAVGEGGFVGVMMGFALLIPSYSLAIIRQSFPMGDQSRTCSDIRCERSVSAGSVNIPRAESPSRHGAK